MNRPPEQDLKALIQQEHRRAELERLRAGFEGCGCSDCQLLYATLDLGKYEGRVRSYGGIIGISAGKPGTDLWAEYHLEPSPDGSEGFHDEQNNVSEMADRAKFKKTGIMIQGKGRGRPRKKDGELVSRMTKWRRKREKEVQGVLL